ncbi:unnamed protein product [Phaeothamnion confervicola]
MTGRTRAVPLLFLVLARRNTAFSLTSGRLTGSARQQRRLTMAAQPTPVVDSSRVAVLFDFDGTLGDTETPAMEVAYWELAPFFVSTAQGQLPSMAEYIRDNAGKAFEFMVEAANHDRAAAGLSPIAAAAVAGSAAPPALPPTLAAAVDAGRKKFGLPPLAEVIAAGTYPGLLQQQKEETVAALAAVAGPTPGVVAALDRLRAAGVPFAIATTSPKPRVPVSVVACGLSGYFPEEKIHSGESDFDPPRFKPDPAVYLKAAAHEGALPRNCVAVEDSASGVGSASNAGIGFIVGYVGASHIPADSIDGHAKSLMAGTRADDGRGAEIVIESMDDLPPLVERFAGLAAKAGAANAATAAAMEVLLAGGKAGRRVWLRKPAPVAL